MNQSNSRPTDRGDAQPNPRLGPRPIHRPAVDPHQAATFGRPRNISGPFDASARPAGADSPAAKRHSGAIPAPLAEAFGRPNGVVGADSLQRNTDASTVPSQDSQELTRRSSNGVAQPLWSESSDPWRDPQTYAVLGNPALEEDQDKADAATSSGPQLSLSEIIFGRRVQPIALTVLALVAVVIGAVGGLIGWWVADTGDGLRGDATIAEASAGKEREPGSVADIAQRVAPAVIKIDVTSGPDQPGDTGSGVMIDPQGYAITNAHVISRALNDPQMKISAIFIDGTRSEAKLVGADPKTDLAVIKVAVSNPTVMQVGKTADLAAGDAVLAIGSPLRLANTVTEGIVSAVNRPISVPGEPGQPTVTYDAIQTDASINPGNSGGALVDSTGALIGINSSIKTGGSAGEGGSIGIGFAIPADTAMKIVDKLIKDGKVQHAELGVSAISVLSDVASGAKVQDVADGGPGANAGIVEGDIVTKIGDRDVRDAAELTVAVRAHEVGATIPVQLVRQGRQLTIDVTLGSD